MLRQATVIDPCNEEFLRTSLWEMVNEEDIIAELKHIFETMTSARQLEIYKLKYPNHTLVFDDPHGETVEITNRYGSTPFGYDEYEKNGVKTRFRLDELANLILRDIDPDGVALCYNTVVTGAVIFTVTCADTTEYIKCRF